LNVDIEELQRKEKSRERAVLELTLRLGMKPYEILRLERQGKSEEEAISEFLKGKKLHLDENSPEVRKIVSEVTREKLYETSPTRFAGHEKPSRVWYLVPLFFGLLGGLVGYFAVKDGDRDMASNLLVLGVFVSFVVILATWWLWL